MDKLKIHQINKRQAFNPFRQQISLEKHKNDAKDPEAPPSRGSFASETGGFWMAGKETAGRWKRRRVPCLDQGQREGQTGATKLKLQKNKNQKIRKLREKNKCGWVGNHKICHTFHEVQLQQLVWHLSIAHHALLHRSPGLTLGLPQTSHSSDICPRLLKICVQF